jgi:hypothetical protein
VTFVFSDIGSTRLFHRIGDRYPRLLARHNRISRDTWRASGGAEVKTEKRLAHADEVVSRARPVLIAKAGGFVVA